MGLLDWILGRRGNASSYNRTERPDGAARAEKPKRARRQPQYPKWPSGLSPWLKQRRLWHVARHIDDHYREFDLELPGGKTRRIAAPDRKLAFIQRRILRRVLNKQELSPHCHAFRRGYSIVTGARPHVGKEMVLAVDVADFFPTVTFPRVFGLFRSLGYPTRQAALLARLTTYKGTLPQGAPTSPAIANLVCRKLDRRLSALAAKAGASYTRYADDLTFSGPLDIVRLRPLIAAIVADEGFTLNAKKTRLMRRHQRQQVTGLVVNERVGLPRIWRRRLRAACHRLRSGASPTDPHSVLWGRLALPQDGSPEALQAGKEGVGWAIAPPCHPERSEGSF